MSPLFACVAAQDRTVAGVLAAIAVFLFLAVWIPCCTSDIVFPLLFAPQSGQPPKCPHHHE